jgi:hypothetical protein
MCLCVVIVEKMADDCAMVENYLVVIPEKTWDWHEEFTGIVIVRKCFNKEGSPYVWEEKRQWYHRGDLPLFWGKGKRKVSTVHPAVKW